MTIPSYSDTPHHSTKGGHRSPWLTSCLFSISHPGQSQQPQSAVSCGLWSLIADHDINGHPHWISGGQLLVMWPKPILDGQVPGLQF